MTPQEIRHLLTESPALHKAMEAEKQRIWQFLRQEVTSGYAITICVQCRQMGILLETPYRPDLCIDCLLMLMEQLKDDPITEKYRDTRSRFYDARYDEQCKIWDDLDTIWLPDDYDGPPIVIA
jgi:hypothetical protein